MPCQRNLRYEDENEIHAGLQFAAGEQSCNACENV